MYTHAGLTVAGIDAPSPVSITGTGCEMNIAGAGWTNVATNINNGEAYSVRTTSPASGGASTSCTLLIGGVSDVFTVTTISNCTSFFVRDDATFDAAYGILAPTTYTNAGAAGGILLWDGLRRVGARIQFH